MPQTQLNFCSFEIEDEIDKEIIELSKNSEDFSLEDFKQWFQRFHQHEFFTPPFKEPVNPSSMPKESTSDA